MSETQPIQVEKQATINLSITLQWIDNETAEIFLSVPDKEGDTVVQYGSRIHLHSTGSRFDDIETALQYSLRAPINSFGVLCSRRPYDHPFADLFKEICESGTGKDPSSFQEKHNQKIADTLSESE